MIYFCADDYGISEAYNKSIEECLKNGALNKVSILPNGEITDFVSRLTDDPDTVLALHVNLVEGKPLSPPDEIGLLVDESGHFKYSFVGLLRLSLSPKRKELERQLYTEIRTQVRFFRDQLGEDKRFAIDSHQHTIMIPSILRALLKVISDEGMDVRYLRVPAEPILPYLLTPSLYSSIRPVGIVKQWLLNALAFFNRPRLKKAGVRADYFMGVLFSGKLDENKVRKLLVHYERMAKKHGKNIEIGFHPGCCESSHTLIDGSRADFKKFYCSPWRNIEYETLMSLGSRKNMKEGTENAVS